MGKAYDLSKLTTWISYIDVTNLYGWTISQFLPIGNYWWKASWAYLLKNPAIQKKYLERILKTKADASRRYFLNIKAYFSLKTYDYLADLLLVVKNIAIEKNWFSPFNKKFINKLDDECFFMIKKLVSYLRS